MSIIDMPDDSWVSPKKAREAYGVPVMRYKYWAKRGWLSRRGAGAATVVHLGDFRSCATGSAGSVEWLEMQEREATRVVEMFESPLPPGQCARPGCDQPRDPDDHMIFMCPEHQVETTRHKTVQARCIQCQDPLRKYSTGVRCRRCAVSHHSNKHSLEVAV